MTKNLVSLRKEFPSLDERYDGRRLVYLDSACTVLKMRCAADAQRRHMLFLGGCGGKRSVHSLAAAMEEDFYASRRAVAEFMGAASPEEVVFTAGVTDAVNLLISEIERHPGEVTILALGPMTNIALALRIVPESRNPTAVSSLDLPGVGLISSAMFCLTFALVEGQKYGWTSATILSLLAGCGLLFAAFYLRERRARQPLIDFSLFRRRNFLAGNVTGLILSFGMMGVFFTVPIFLQTVLGYSAMKAGAVMSPMSVAVMFSAPFAGRLSDKVGSRWLICAGLLLMAFGIAWMAGLTPIQAGLTPSTRALSLILPFVVSGLGIGLAGGLASGLLGIGGAILMIPLMVWLVRLPQHEAQATSLVLMLAPIGLPGVIVYARHGSLPWLALAAHS